MLINCEDYYLTVSRGLKVSLLRPSSGFLTARVEIWGESKASMGDVQSALGLSQLCPASCLLDPARRLLRVFAQHWGSYRSEL